MYNEAVQILLKRLQQITILLTAVAHLMEVAVILVVEFM